MLVDYHMHLEQGEFTLPWLEEFLAAARARGIDEIGITEHSYRFIQAHGLLDNDWARARERADLDRYVRCVEEAKSLGWPVRLGIEMDYVPGREEAIAEFLDGYPWDLVLGSIHWLGCWGLDLDPRTWEGRDPAAVWREYFATLRRAAASGLFDVLAHPDLVKIFGFRPPETVVAEEFAATVEVARQAGVCLEVSSAGLRKPVGEIYPGRAMLDLAHAAGVPITLASDAHHPRDVGYAYHELMAHATASGYREVARFERRRRTAVPLTPAAPAAAARQDA